MSLTLEEVKHIAWLARIDIGELDARAMQAQLNDIFNLIGQLQSANTQGVEPMTHAQNVAMRLREDAVTESDQRELFQSLAPQVEAGLYLVPKVIE